GLAWSGNPHLPNDHNRSVPLELLAPLLSLGVECHSLQKEYRAGDEATLNTLPALNRWHDHLNDFTDTAALLMHMDLVISVDTSIAHLAGALGKQVWLMLPKSADYRWLVDRDDTPWYPSMRLYRQEDFGDWTSIIARLQRDLTRLVAA
ncbi:MAG: glycosyltransferase, partial [Burkholderiales bacterium]|nr:glycosyltransferase [Burkholderiales bacterium]